MPPHGVRRWPAPSGVHETWGVPIFRSYVVRLLWAVYTIGLTRAGRWLLFITLFIAFIGSITLDAPFYLLLCYSAAVWLVALAGAWMVRLRLELQGRHAAQIAAGGELPIDITITSRSPSILHELQIIPRMLPLSMDPLPAEGIALAALAPGESRTLRLQVQCRRRGIYTLKGYRVQTAFPAGIVNSSEVYPHEQRLVVYPAFHPVTSMTIPSGQKYQPGGVALASTVGQALEYAGNREFQVGDDVRLIDWRASARLGELIVREYREEYFHRVAVILDTHTPQGGAEAEEAFEAALSLAATISEYLSRGEYLVDIFAAGDSLYHLTAGRSLAYFDQILEILACVEPSRTAPWSRLRPALSEHALSITTAFCIFLDWDGERAGLVDDLRIGGAAVHAYVVRSGKPRSDPGPDADLITPEQVRSGPLELR